MLLLQLNPNKIAFAGIQRDVSNNLNLSAWNLGQITPKFPAHFQKIEKKTASCCVT